MENVKICSGDIRGSRIMKEITVLICDDNPAISKSLSGYFTDLDISVLNASSGEEALSLFDSNNIDLVILDLMLPGMLGNEVCEKIRSNYKIPIIILSAKSDAIDRISMLEIGADDYVTKPFSPKEVVLRAQKLLKLYSMYPELDGLKVGELSVYPESYEVFVNGEKVVLATKEFEVLRFLITHAGKVMSRERIMNEVWGVNYVGESRIVDIMITRLRKKLIPNKEEAHFAITTVFGVGYKLEEV